MAKICNDRITSNMVRVVGENVDGNIYPINKAKDINEAKGQLLELQGKNHKLITSIAIAKNGSIVWKHRDTSNISMRKLNSKDGRSIM